MDHYKSYHSRRFDVLNQEQCSLGFQRRKMVMTPEAKGVGRRMLTMLSNLSKSTLRSLGSLTGFGLCQFEFFRVCDKLVDIIRGSEYSLYTANYTIITHKFRATRVIKVRF